MPKPLPWRPSPYGPVPSRFGIISSYVASLDFAFMIPRGSCLRKTHTSICLFYLDRLLPKHVKLPATSFQMNICSKYGKPPILSMIILRIGQKISEPLPGNKLQGIFRSSIVSLMEVFFSHLRSDFCQPSHPAILPAPQANAVFSWIDRKIIQTSCRRLFSPCLEKQS